MEAIEQLLKVVAAYRDARGVSDARVSTLVFNDGNRIEALRSGGDIGTRRLDRAMQWFSDHWPENAAWPADVPRPEVPSPRRSKDATPARLDNSHSH